MASISFFADANIKNVSVGMTASYSRTITQEVVNEFANLSGDKNPVHLDDEYARNSRFKRRIAHGFISASFFSALFGTRIPGPGCVYVAQSLEFKRPVYVGDTVTATVTVTNVQDKAGYVGFETTCYVGSKVVIKGNAIIYIPKVKADSLMEEG